VIRWCHLERCPDRIQASAGPLKALKVAEFMNLTSPFSRTCKVLANHVSPWKFWRSPGSCSCMFWSLQINKIEKWLELKNCDWMDVWISPCKYLYIMCKIRPIGSLYCGVTRVGDFWHLCSFGMQLQVFYQFSVVLTTCYMSLSCPSYHDVCHTLLTGIWKYIFSFLNFSFLKLSCEIVFFWD